MESKNKTTELIATENRSMVAGGEGWGGDKMLGGEIFSTVCIYNK